MDSDLLRQRYERASQWPLIGLAVLFVVAYAWRVLGIDLPGWASATLAAITLVVWPVFLADYVIRLWLARRRWRFVRQNWLDGLAVALPLLRPLRIISLVRVARVIDRRLTGSLHGRVAGYITATGALIVFMGSLAVLDAERGAPEATIDNFGDALWWAMTTISTVGYGDTHPVTVQGRLVAVLLMLSGVALLGVVTAAVASWFVGRVTDAAAAPHAIAAAAPDTTAETALLAEVRALSAEVSALRGELRDRSTAG